MHPILYSINFSNPSARPHISSLVQKHIPQKHWEFIRANKSSKYTWISNFNRTNFKNNLLEITPREKTLHRSFRLILTKWIRTYLRCRLEMRKRKQVAAKLGDRAARFLSARVFVDNASVFAPKNTNLAAPDIFIFLSSLRNSVLLVSRILVKIMLHRSPPRTYLGDNIIRSIIN